MPADKVDVKQLRDHYNRLITEVWIWKALWQEIGDYMVPWRNQIITLLTPGTKLTDRIFDSTAPQALTTAASAIHSSVTPDNLRWFSFTLNDPRLLLEEGVLPWLDDLANTVFRVITESNFASEAQELYGDLLAFGTGVMWVEENPAQYGIPFSGIRFHTQQPGTFVVSEGATGVVDTVIREIPMRVGAMARRWGKDKLSEQAQSMLDHDKPYEMRKVIHFIYPRVGGRDNQLAPRGRRIASVWTEQEAVSGYPPVGSGGSIGTLHLIDERGFDEMPVMAPRWRKISGETYGRSPGMNVLPDVRTLNQAVELRLKAWTLAIAPPLQTPDRGVVGQIRLEPYGRIYTRPGAKVEPLNIPANFDVANIQEDRLQAAIRAGFFVDLLQFQSKEGTPISATEASIRFQTMQRILGPVVSRLQSEFLSPMIQRVVNIVLRARGVVPPPPTALQRKNIALELVFEGPLARVQRSADVESINQFMSLLFPVGEVIPGVLDRVDEQSLVEALAHAVALPAHILRSREAAAQITQQKQQKQEQQQMIQNVIDAAPIVQKGQQIAQTGKTLNAFSSARPPTAAGPANPAQ